VPETTGLREDVRVALHYRDADVMTVGAGRQCSTKSEAMPSNAIRVGGASAPVFHWCGLVAIGVATRLPQVA
jgi:hypothetical protein